MFMIVDAAPVGATRFANETAIWRMTAGKSGIELRDRADRGEGERDDVELREGEPEDEPRPVGGLQRGPQVGEAPDLAEDDPEREQQRRDRQQLHRADASQLHRPDEHALGVVGERPSPARRAGPCGPAGRDASPGVSAGLVR